MSISNLDYRPYTLNNFKTMPHFGKIPEKMVRDIEIVGSVLPFRANNYVTEELIDWKNIETDPIFTLTFPRREMLTQQHYNEMEAAFKTGDTAIIKQRANSIRMQLNPHPAGQHLNVPEIDGEKLLGSQHKYRETILFFPSQGQSCHAYCTFCFRWPQFTGIKDLKFAMNEVEKLGKYIKNNKNITDILFTGGDPMVMSAELLDKYISPFLEDEYSHIQTIRIGTKSLAYWPYRYVSDKDSDDIIRLFEKVIKRGKTLAFMAHFNHPVELSTDVVQIAIRRILATGAQIRTQSPVLRHINDDENIWADMWRAQTKNRCIPYYMFIPRDTGAAHYFSVPLVKAWDIYRKAYQSVSGICRTVRGPSMSCTPGKVQVLGVSEVHSKKLIAMRMLQGRNPDWVGRPFFAEYDENAVWIDGLKPAFGEKEFFFEKELEEKYNEHFYDHEPENFE